MTIQDILYHLHGKTVERTVTISDSVLCIKFTDGTDIVFHVSKSSLVIYTDEEGKKIAS